jgi:mitochondrial inner membrane protease subunit 1
MPPRVPLPDFLARHLGHPAHFLKSALKTVILAHLFVAYGLEWNSARGASMLPTLPVMGEMVLIDKRYRLGRGIAVGDLVAFWIPVFHHSPAIKRVVGMPGDYVLLRSPDSGSDDMIQVRVAGLIGGVSLVCVCKGSFTKLRR